MCKCDLIKFSNLFYDKIKFTLKKKFQTRYKKNYSYKFFTPFEIPMKNFI